MGLLLSAVFCRRDSGAGLIIWVLRAAHEHHLLVPTLPNLESGEFLHTAAILTALGTAGLGLLLYRQRTDFGTPRYAGSVQ